MSYPGRGGRSSPASERRAVSMRLLWAGCISSVPSCCIHAPPPSPSSRLLGTVPSLHLPSLSAFGKLYPSLKISLKPHSHPPKSSMNLPHPHPGLRTLPLHRPPPRLVLTDCLAHLPQETVYIFRIGTKPICSLLYPQHPGQCLVKLSLRKCLLTD